MKTKNEDKIKDEGKLNEEEDQIEASLNRKIALKKVLKKIISDIKDEEIDNNKSK